MTEQKLIFTFDPINNRVFYLEVTEIVTGRSLEKAECTESRGDAPTQLNDFDLDFSNLAKKENENTVAIILSGKQYTSSAFIFKVRSFVCDANNQPIYSETAEKLVVPRAVVTKIKATSRTTGKVSWNKISGAKKYTVYVSSNNGKKYKKAGSTKSKSFTIKNMKLGKT